MIRYVIADNPDPGDRFVLGFRLHVDDKNLDVLQAMKDAVADYCRTPAGRDALQYAAGNFNYGDFADHVPNEICKRHGFFVMETFTTELIPGHNDRLYEPEP